MAPAGEVKTKLRCLHDGVELTGATLEFDPRPHVVLEFTFKVGRAAAGKLYVDSANINPMTASSEYVAEMNDAISAFKGAMLRVFTRYLGVMHTTSDVDEEPEDPVQV